MPREVFIIEAVRTPVGAGRSKGSLHNFHPVDLLALTLSELATRAGIDKSEVEDVICGCVTPIGKQGANIARLAALKAGFPIEVPGVTLNRMCGSSQQSIHNAAQAIASGDQDMVIACGVEMMSVEKMGSDTNLFSRKDTSAAEFKKHFPYKLLHQGVSADLIGSTFGITREDCDNFAINSHRKCYEATVKGRFDSQIVPVHVKQSDGTFRVFDRDECIRWPANKAKIAQLKTVFTKNGVVTAGNASQISDGAAAVLLCSREKAEELGLKMRVKVITRVVVGCDPVLMLTGPIPATHLALKKSGLSMNDMDIVEINEAFAVVVLRWLQEFNPDNSQEFMSKINPNGGAIAHGHPLGATGAILATKAVNELERLGASNPRPGKPYRALQTMCIGHGNATATIFELVTPSSSSSSSSSNVVKLYQSGVSAGKTSCSTSTSTLLPKL